MQVSFTLRGCLKAESKNAFATSYHAEVVVFVVIKINLQEPHSPVTEPGLFILLVMDSTYRSEVARIFSRSYSPHTETAGSVGAWTVINSAYKGCPCKPKSWMVFGPGRRGLTTLRALFTCFINWE